MKSIGKQVQIFGMRSEVISGGCRYVGILDSRNSHRVIDSKAVLVGSSGPFGRPSGSPKEMIEKRYASGEINQDEYESMKKTANNRSVNLEVLNIKFRKVTAIVQPESLEAVEKCLKKHILPLKKVLMLPCQYQTKPT